MAEAENTKRAPEIKARPVESLTANPRNARKHTPAQVTQIVESIRAYGWTAPLIIDETGLVLAGHGRLLAAQELGLRKVPCVVKRGLTDRQKRAYLLADNKIAENSTWDRALLSVELAELVTGPVTGFSLREMASLIEPREAIEAAPAKPSVATAKSGDLYELGKHRVLCGDATNAADVKRVAPDGWDVAVLDPPFEMDKLHHLTDPSVVFYSSIRDVVQIPRELIRFERVIDKKKKHRIEIGRAHV